MTNAQLFCKGFFCNRPLWLAVARGALGLAGLGVILAIAMTISHNWGIWIFLGLVIVVAVPVMGWMIKSGTSKHIRAGLKDTIDRPTLAERGGSLAFLAISQGTLWGVGVHALLYLFVSFIPSHRYDAPVMPGFFETLPTTVLYGQILGLFFMAEFITTKPLKWAIYAVLGVVIVTLLKFE